MRFRPIVPAGFLAAFSIFLCFFASTSPAGAASEVDAPQISRTSCSTIVFRDQIFDFQLRRTLGYAVSGGADINECLCAAARIKEGDVESWYGEWKALGDRIGTEGDKSLKAGQRVSARNAFLRASAYYRTAEFFLCADPADPRILSTFRQSRECFMKAAKLMDHPLEAVAIPYEGAALPGYVMRPEKAATARKTLIVQTGFDGTAEELYFATARFALERGYTVILFEGPGQGGALRESGLHFRPDWEKVVSRVVDFALTRREVDPKRIALLGVSMGGHLAARAAAYEPRLAALVVNPGTLNLLSGKGTPSAQEIREMSKDPTKADGVLRGMMERDFGLNWYFRNGMFAFGKKTPLDVLVAMSAYDLEESVELIRCPTLVAVSDEDGFQTVESQMKLHDRLTCPKTLIRFTSEDAAGYHCQVGALALSNQRILDGLDAILDRIRIR